MACSSLRAARSRALVIVAIFPFATMLAGPSDAHPLAPSLLELREEGGGRFEVLWKTPLLRAPGAELSPILPDHCREIDAPSAERGETDVRIRWRVDCGATGITGETLAVEGLDRSRTTALVRVELSDGRRVRSLLRADASSYVVEEAESRMDLARSYMRLGATHIWLGPDHLLFVLGLLFLIHGRRRLIMAITAFTVGHSITLALATLDWLRVPSRPVELGIAISLIIVALELCRDEDARESMVRLRPWSISFAFGLLHGLGFAGALREAGLPPDEIPLALLCFNLGIEFGQLVFIAIALGAIALLGPWMPVRGWIQRVPGYAIGSLAAFWIIERARALF